MPRRRRASCCRASGLKNIEDQFPGSLSGGMKRRVEIVRALMNDPKILLLDEPFRALDALTKSVVQEFLLELYDLTPKTVFFITHDVEEAVFLADKIVVMTTRPGRVLKIVECRHRASARLSRPDHEPLSSKSSARFAPQSMTRRARRSRRASGSLRDDKHVGDCLRRDAGEAAARGTIPPLARVGVAI